MTQKIKRTPVTRLCRYTKHSVHYRERDLVADLLGKSSFVDVFLSQVFGKSLAPKQVAVIDAVLVVLMEHGMTPSAISSRLIYASSPENIQSAIAAGLLAVGSQFVGTMEDAALLLAQIVAADDKPAAAAQIVQEHRSQKKHVPGFGHHLHTPDDPRAAALIRLAKDLDVAGAHCTALELLAREVDKASGRHITINATGAVAALLGDAGVPVRLMRGFAVLSRTAGLIAHIAEEQADPSGRFIWDLVDKSMTPD